MIIINKGKLVADGTSEELSRAARQERVLLLDVEGEEVDASLRSLAGLEQIDFQSVDTGRVRAKLVTDKKVELRPEISRLARERGWTIWRLEEEEHKLEDIFHKLTA
jgi:ABC-type multidrug transport system ATPase subunit